MPCHLILASVASLSLSHAGLPQSDSPVNSLVVLSGPGIQRSAYDYVPDPMKAPLKADLPTIFSPNTYLVIESKKSRGHFVAVHRLAEPLATLMDQCEALEGIEKTLNSDLVCDAKTMPKSNRVSMERQIRKLHPFWRVPPSSTEAGFKLAISPTIQFVLSSGADSKGFSYMPGGGADLRSRQNNQLMASPLQIIEDLPPVDSKGVPLPISQEVQDQFERDRTLTAIYAFGPQRLQSESLVGAIDEFSKLIQEAENRKLAVTKRLEGPLVANFAQGLGGAFPDRVDKVSDLPKDVRDQVVRSFAESWRVNGFASRDLAEAFAAKASIQNMRVSVTLTFDVKNDKGEVKRWGHHL